MGGSGSDDDSDESHAHNHAANTCNEVNDHHLDANSPDPFLKMFEWGASADIMKDEKGKIIDKQVQYDVMFGYLCKMGITGQQIELIEIKTKEQIKKLKTAFQLRFP